MVNPGNSFCTFTYTPTFMSGCCCFLYWFNILCYFGLLRHLSIMPVNKNVKKKQIDCSLQNHKGNYPGYNNDMTTWYSYFLFVAAEIHLSVKVWFSLRPLYLYITSSSILVYEYDLRNKLWKLIVSGNWLRAMQYKGIMFQGAKVRCHVKMLQKDVYVLDLSHFQY